MNDEFAQRQTQLDALQLNLVYFKQHLQLVAEDVPTVLKQGFDVRSFADPAHFFNRDEILSGRFTAARIENESQSIENGIEIVRSAISLMKAHWALQAKRETSVFVEIVDKCMESDDKYLRATYKRLSRLNRSHIDLDHPNAFDQAFYREQMREHVDAYFGAEHAGLPKTLKAKSEGQLLQDVFEARMDCADQALQGCNLRMQKLVTGFTKALQWEHARAVGIVKDGPRAQELIAGELFNAAEAYPRLLLDTERIDIYLKRLFEMSDGQPDETGPFKADRYEAVPLSILPEFNP